MAGKSKTGWRIKLDPRPGAGNWLCYFSLNGKKHTLSTRTTDRSEAQSIAAELYAEVVSGRRVSHERSSVTSLDLVDLFAKWLEYSESALDPTTIKQYTCYTSTHWLPFFKTLSRITTKSITEYWRARLHKVTRCTVSKELSALATFLAWASHEGLYPDGAPTVTRVPKRSPGKRDTRKNRKKSFLVFSSEEAEAIISHLPEFYGRPGKQFPIKARFEVMWETSLRPATLDAICAPEDYRVGDTTLRIRSEIDKARFGREVPLTERARAALDRVAPEVGLIFGEHDAHVFSKCLRDAATAAGIDAERAGSISPYDLRHSCLTNWGASSSNLMGMAYLAGHKNATTTNKYLHPHQRAASDVLASLKRPVGSTDRSTTPPEGIKQVLEASRKSSD